MHPNTYLLGVTGGPRPQQLLGVTALRRAGRNRTNRTNTRRVPAVKRAVERGAHRNFCEARGTCNLR